jgi:hypothetical protein
VAGSASQGAGDVRALSTGTEPSTLKRAVWDIICVYHACYRGVRACECLFVAQRVPLPTIALTCAWVSDGHARACNATNKIAVFTHDPIDYA